MTKKLICILLIALLCAPLLVSCSQDSDVPDGMFSATIDGEPFILYVPDGWTDNCDSGISSAYYGLNVIASARYYTPEDANETLEGCVEHHVESLKAKYESFSFTRKEAKLGKSEPAIRIEYDFARDAVQNGSATTSTARAIQYFAMNGTDVVMLSFYCESSAFEEYAEAFEQIRAEFVMRERSIVNECVTDKNTPEGMKLASSDLEYRFYVPTTWVTNQSDAFSSAYYAESGRPNVSVTSYSLSEEMSAEKYFEFCAEEYEATLEGYEFISSSERTVHDRNAISYVYKAVYGGTEIRIMQTVFIYNDLAYSITYTAHADRFDAHIDDVNAMLDNFKLR